MRNALLSALALLLATPGWATPQMMAGATEGAAVTSGEVLETMNAGGYTYVRIATDDGERWVAGPLTEVAVGDKVDVKLNMGEMRDFNSSSLRRTFESIWFTGAITVTATDLSATHGVAARVEIEPVDVAPLDGGYTIARLHADRSKLAGKPVSVRGQVTKFSEGIKMSVVDTTNWIHLRDGTGNPDDKTDDLAVATNAVVEPGQVIVVRGELRADVDTGVGYAWAVLIVDATVEAE